MKKLLLLVCWPLFMSAQMDLSGTEGKGWLTDYETALVEAKKEQKNVLVYFTGSDWCPPCKMLKKDLFDTEKFRTVSRRYALLYIDIPRKRDILTPKQMEHNSDVLAKLNKKGVFPLMVILDPKGTVLDEYSGYGMDGEIQGHLNLLGKYKN